MLPVLCVKSRSQSVGDTCSLNLIVEKDQLTICNTIREVKKQRESYGNKKI